LWIETISREDWEPRAGDRVCGRHFVYGQPSDDLHSIDYVPHSYMISNVVPKNHTTDRMVKTTVRQQDDASCEG
jgi:hypothetical protein